MGKLVTCWSPFKGHGMTTSSLCAILGGMMLQYPELNMAISYTQEDSTDLMMKFDYYESVYRKIDVYENVGIDALKLYIRQMELSEDIIERCGIPLQAKNIRFYPNIHSTVSDEKLIFRLLTQMLKRSFDIVFLDLESGNPDRAVPYMREADLAVIMLPQEPAYIERFIREEEKNLDRLEYGIVFGGSLPGTKYNSTYYKKKTTKTVSNRILGQIHCNTSFFDAMCDGKTIDFFLRNQMAEKKEENYEFICQAKKTAEKICQQIILA